MTVSVLSAAAPDLRDALKDLLEVSRGLLHTASQSDIRVPSGEPEEFQQAEDALDRVEE